MQLRIVMNMKKPIVIAISALLLGLCVWVAIALRSNIPETPELALQGFYEREVAEDQIMDPLIFGRARNNSALGEGLGESGNAE